MTSTSQPGISSEMLRSAQVSVTPTKIKVSGKPTTSADIFRPSVHNPGLLAVLCPPYAPLGGNHKDYVLQAIARHLTARHHALSIAFSYRSRTSWTGSAEVENLKDVVAWGREEMVKELVQRGLDAEGSKTNVLLVGYSYGGLVVSRWEADERQGAELNVKRVLVSPPLGITGSALMLKKVATSIPGEGLVVWGDSDNWTAKASYTIWSKGLGENWTGAEVRGNHFFHEGTEELLEAIDNWVTDHYKDL